VSRPAIARVWRGVTRAADTDAYLEFLDRTGVADCRATPGNLGVMVLHRAEGDRTEFLFVSFWDDMASVTGFAGAEPARARFYPEDEQFLVDRDLHVQHYAVARDVSAAAPETSAGSS
jgi:heme-degrading monooxygenase HmoA